MRIVKELAREAFKLEHVVSDGDGDLPFPYGTAMVYVSGGQGPLMRVWSRAVAGIPVSTSVLRELSEVNAGLVIFRICVGLGGVDRGPHAVRGAPAAGRRLPGVLLTLDHADLGESVGVLDARTVRRVDDGLRLVLSLS